MPDPKEFKERYHKNPTDTIFCPYRICPLGAHVDHQLGLVTGFTLDRGISLEYTATEDGSVSIASKNFEGWVNFNLSSLPEKQSYWGDFAVGAAKMLSEKYTLAKGFEGLIEGTLPVGGLSSSAAVIITYLNILCRVNNITLTQPQMIQYAIRVEREFIGVNVGKLDQSCEIYCKKDKLLYLDTQDDSMELIPRSPDMPPFKIAIIYSGVSRKLAGSAYNLRVDECRAAAYALKAYSGMEYGKIAETNLREVPESVYQEFKEGLPENWRKRAHHYYNEQGRVRRGVEAWRRGDIATFGEMIFQSGRSSIYYYEAGSEPLRALYEIMLRTEGVYGGRFSGAGFNGCCMAIVDPDKQESIREHITNEYAKVFPEYMEEFVIEFCDTADGAQL